MSLALYDIIYIIIAFVLHSFIDDKCIPDDLTSIYSCSSYTNPVHSGNVFSQLYNWLVDYTPNINDLCSTDKSSDTPDDSSKDLSKNNDSSDNSESSKSSDNSGSSKSSDNSESSKSSDSSKESKSIKCNTTVKPTKCSTTTKPRKKIRVIICRKNDKCDEKHNYCDRRVYNNCYNTYNTYNYYNTTSPTAPTTTVIEKENCPDKFPDKCSDRKYDNMMITDTTKETKIKFNNNSIVEVELTGGGGAGGVGVTYQNLYLYGGGGGAGQTIKKKINVVAGEEWIITVGKGGVSKSLTNGGVTSIRSVFNGHNKFIMNANGGMNGLPINNSINNININALDQYVKGGKGGVNGETVIYNCVSSVLCNDNINSIGDGEDGQIGAPSVNAQAGCGGSTSTTGPKGYKGNSVNSIGGDGLYGSGGGGSIPYSTLLHPDKYSGNGGNGYVKLNILKDDFCC